MLTKQVHLLWSCSGHTGWSHIRMVLLVEPDGDQTAMCSN